jgi:hypothetical protein
MANIVDPLLAKVFLAKFETKDHIKNWISTFLELDFPDSWVDPDSNSSPIDWMYETYMSYKKNEGNINPEIIVISSRESYKTLSEAVFGVIMMIHFGATLAHMAAIVPQATAAQKYINSFMEKVAPYLEYHNRALNSQNAKEISIKNPDGTVSFMKIIVCTITGANSSHTNLFTIDEIDTIRSQEGIRAYKEAQMIPGVFNGQYPITIKTSTMKFPGGLFSKEMEKAAKNGYKVRRWNIIDITEKCPTERHRPDLPLQTLYLSQSLPLKTIIESEYISLTNKEQEKFDKFEAMGGCATCSLLPVCRGRLAERKDSDKGGLWKPIDFTISQFKKTDPDLAEAQLMCWKPSSAGMVYPRFLNKDIDGNTYTLAQAWEAFTGDKAPAGITLPFLIESLHKKDIKFYCGTDWGFRHAFAITVSAIMPNGEWWLVDTYSVSGLEFEQMMDLAKSIRDMYRPKKWFCDTAQPMFIKAFKNNKMPCGEFKKDIMGGISAVRGQIIDATGRRRLKVIRHDRNDWLLKVFAEHCFLLDSNGNLTQEPDDSEVADVADSLRYMAQNLFQPKKKGQVYNPLSNVNNTQIANNITERKYEDWLTQKARELATGPSGSEKGNSGSVFWDFGGNDE